MSKPLYCCDQPQLEWRGTDLSNMSVYCTHCGFVLCDDGQLADWHDPEEIARARDYHVELLWHYLPEPAKARYEGNCEPANDVEILPYLIASRWQTELLEEEEYALAMHVFGNYLQQQKTEPPSELREEVERYRVLEDRLQAQLTDLKGWIQKQKERHYKERHKHSEYERPEPKKPEQLALDLFAEGRDG